MADLTPTEWFDQFPDAPGWEHDQWCARHWAPCPILGANGIGASVALMQVFVNEQMRAAGRLCCALGDERMYELWGRWPPVGDAAP